MLSRLMCIFVLVALATAGLLALEDDRSHHHHHHHPKEEGEEETETDEYYDDNSTSPIPQTNFTCTNRTDGFYADTETACSIFHYCQSVELAGDRVSSVDNQYQCPETTFFSQEFLTCAAVDDNSQKLCADSATHFDVNQNITETQNNVTSIVGQANATQIAVVTIPLNARLIF